MIDFMPREQLRRQDDVVGQAIKWSKCYQAEFACGETNILSSFFRHFLHPGAYCNLRRTIWTDAHLFSFTKGWGEH